MIAVAVLRLGSAVQVVDLGVFEGITLRRDHAGNREEFRDVDVVVPLVELVVFAGQGFEKTI